MEVPPETQTDDAAPGPRPRSRLTLQVRRDVLVDQLAYRLTTNLVSMPEPAEIERISDEVDEALTLFADRGWTTDAASYHEAPTPPESIRSARRRSGNVRYTSLTWLDGYAPRPEEPGAQRFVEYPKNHVARAAILEHRTRDRPWLVAIHGFGMGTPALDLRAMRVLRFHRALDLNVALLTLPMHGRRSPTGIAKPMMPSADVMDTVHGLAQAVWDARQLLAMLRDRTDQPVTLLGVSLGGLVSSLVSSIDRPDGVVPVVPAVDMVSVMIDGVTRALDDDGEALEILERSRPLYNPVSPLHMTPQVPREHRFLVAGTLDQFVRPSAQVIALWRHWEEPAIHWYHGGHASVFWNGGVQPFVESALQDHGLA